MGSSYHVSMLLLGLLMLGVSSLALFGPMVLLRGVIGLLSGVLTAALMMEARE